MIQKQETEHALRRYLKRKISYGIGLLVCYLITGQVRTTGAPAESASRAPDRRRVYDPASTDPSARQTLGPGNAPPGSRNPEEEGGESVSEEARLARIDSSREDFLSRIAAQKSEIEALLAENEARMRELNSSYEELLRKGDYYSKPVYKSHQVFFTAYYDNAGRMKNRTREALAHDLKLLEDYLAENYDPDMGGMTDRLAADYESGAISGADLAYELLVKGKGIEAAGKPHSIEIELGTNIEVPAVEIPLISREVQVSVAAPGVPNVSTPSVSPSVPSITVPTVSIPSVTPVTAPTISLQVDAPAAQAAISVASVSPTAPSSLSLSAPTVSVSVNPPSVTPTLMLAPAVPNTPDVLTATVNPTGPGVFTVPTSPSSVTPPATPSAPNVSVFTPAVISYRVNGFGQSSPQVVMSSGILFQNYNSYAGNGATITATTASIVTSGASIGYDANLLAPSSYGASIVAIISHTNDGDVTATGVWNYNVTGANNNYIKFLSYDPHNVSADHTWNFAGTLNITGSMGIGLQHELHNIDLMPGTPGTTHLINSGNINIGVGGNATNIVGIMIDDEYWTTGQLSYFENRPETSNNGTITLGDNATNSIGIDYGFFYVRPEPNLTGPNNDLALGNIVVGGNNNYGYRQKDYTNTIDMYSSAAYGNIYYDLTTVTGSNGVIQVNGTNNVGISIAQGMSTGDPISNFTGIQILVGGNQGVGFLRSKELDGYANTNDIVLDGTKVGSNFGFAAGATQSSLIRSDINGIVLSTNLNLTAGSTQNSAMQAGSTGKVTLSAGNTITSSLPTFYGLVAGDFVGSSGAEAINHGTLTFSGANSVGLAVAAGNTGTSDGNITVSGANAVGVFNQGTTAVSGGTITASGNTGTGIYHATGASTAISNTNIVANAPKANGIYNTSGGITLSGGSVSATGASGAGNLATGIYNSGTLNPNNVAISANNYGVGIYNAGTMTVTGGSLTVPGINAIGLYQKAGTTTLAGPITASGANAAGIVYEAGAFSGVASITAAGNNSLGLYNKGTLTATPAVSLTANNATGVYNEAGANLTATGNISTTGAGLTGLTGIYNLGTLVNSTANITINQPAATGIYNDGAVTNIGGSVTVSGTSGNISIGILNRPGRTISNVTGTTTAGNHATAIYNAGTMTVTGAVTANGTAQSTGIYNTGNGSLSLNGAVAINVTGVDGTGIYNDSSSNMAMNAGTLTISGSSSAGLYHRGTGTFTFGGTGVLNASGSSDAGIYNANAAGGHFVMNGGTINAVGVAPNGSVGIYNKGTTADFTLSGGAVNASNEKSTGLYNEGTFTMTGGTVTVTGLSTTGLYNNGSGATFAIGSGNTGTISVTGVKGSTIYDKGGTIHFNGNSTLTAKDGATGVYIAGGTVTTTAGAITTVNVNNTLVSPAVGAGDGVGVFAYYDGTTGSNVDMRNAVITVQKGASGAASYGIGPGAGTTNLNLTGATVDYDGDGFAVYSNGQYGKIDMTNAQLNLRGNSTGVEVDYSLGTPAITFNNTHIDVYSPNVTLINMKDYATPLAVSTLLSGITTAMGAGLVITDHTGGAYTLARLDGGTLAIDTNIARTDASGPGFDYYRRFHGQRVNITVNGGVTASAILTTPQATASYDNQVIGIEASSSSHAVSAAETQINLSSGATIEAARTDTSGPGAVGAYINYGEVHVASGGQIKVQQGYASTRQGAGIFGVNGSIIANDGTIKVAGEKSIGILAMGYRPDAGGVNNIGAEFGASAANQGKITISNTGTITMDDKASIGIYAENNSGAASLPAGTPAWTAADDVVTNTGNITVASGNSATDMSIGMYADQATLKNSGNITVGDYAVGIYGINNSVIDAATGGNLGTIKIGGNSVAVMGTGSTLGSGITNLTLQSDNTTQDKVGIMYNGTPANIDFNIDGSAFIKGTVIYLKNPGATAFTYGSAGKTLKVGANGVGIYLSEGTTPLLASATNDGTIDLLSGSSRAVGMYSEGGLIVNTGTINLQDNSLQVGMYATGVDSSVDNMSGIINLQADHGTGIYLADGAFSGNIGTINFGTVSDAIGILLDGASSSGSSGFTSPNSRRNIYIYAQDKGGLGSSVGVSGPFVVDGVALSGADKTIGVYLKRNSVQNTFGGQITAINGAVGVYSSGVNILMTGVAEAQGNGSIGVYADGGVDLAGMIIVANGAATGESAIGVYATGGVVTPSAGVMFRLGLTNDYGTGMVLAGGATVSGGSIHITNYSTATNVGIYYTGGGTRAHGSGLMLTGQNLVGIFVDGGGTVTNSDIISYPGFGSGFIGAYVSGGSTYESSSTSNQINTANSAEILVGKGRGTNKGTLIVDHPQAAAMAATSANAADTALIVNEPAGVIQADQGVGMLAGALSGAAGISKAENKGVIHVAAGAAGVAIEGATGSFDGTGGVINANGSGSVGIYLEEAVDTQIAALGTLNLGAADAIGVFANKSKIGSPITLGASTTQGIALYATGTAAKHTEISATVDAENSTGTLGVFVADQYVDFQNATVKSGNLGIYVAGMPNYTLEHVNIEAKKAGAVGLYTAATNLQYDAVTTVESGGMGIYVPTGAAIDTAGGTINVNGANSVGIVLAGGTANIGVSGPLALNFGPLGGLGILVSNGGILNIGTLLTVTGTGALAAVENSSLTNTSTIAVNGSTALLGNFTTGGPYTLENGPTGVITVTGGGVGIAAMGAPGSAVVMAKNSGLIQASGKDASGNSSVGIYTEIAEVQNPNKIEVGADGVGIYSKGSGQNVVSNQIQINGAKGVGIVAEGNVPSVTSTGITGGAEAVGLYLKNLTGTVSAGTLVLGDDSTGVYVDGGSVSALSGDITVGNKTAATPIGIYAVNGANVSVSPGTLISGGDNAIAVGADGATVTGVDSSLITLGDGGVQLYTANGGSIGVTGSLVADGNTGILINGSGSITGVSSIDVKNGGVGAYFLGNYSAVPVINIYDGIAPAGGNPAKYSIGAYYSGISGALTLPTIHQIGSHTIGASIDGGAGGTAVSTGNITLGSLSATDQIGIVSKGQSGAPNTLNVGTITVSGTANIGLYGEYTDVTSGNISVGDSAPSADKSTASIGLYLRNGSAATGDVTAGKNAIGLYAEQVNPAGITAQKVTVDDGGVGIYATGSGSENVAAAGTIQVGNSEAMGIYGKDVHIAANGNMSVGAGTSLGIVSEGDGNVNYSGILTVANKGTSTGSIGIYKNGPSGIVTTGAGLWSVGDGGYGIYAQDGGSGAVRVENHADMNLGEAAVGIYGKGVSIENSGNLRVGTTYLGPAGDHADLASHRNSVGIYADAGTSAKNTGIITVDQDHSVGVYVTQATFENAAGGIINVDGSATGILAKNNARAVNNGTINLGSTPGASGNLNIGMAAYGSAIENGGSGVINVQSGSGMYVGSGSTLRNDGTINVSGGSGISGSGEVQNFGTINVSGSGIATQLGSSGGPTEEGSVVIDNGGIQINGNYVTVGGVLHADSPVVLNGPYVDITTFPSQTIPLFDAPDVSGTIRLTPNFPTLGNGWSYKVENFTNALLSSGTTKITVESSPMFLIREVAGALYVAKKPYEELMVPAIADMGGRKSQFSNLYGGLDSVLYADPDGTSKDSIMLKGMNSYLENIYNTEGTRAFNTEAELTTAETRGDIYGNIQSRMRDVQHAFDRSFAELETSYNTSKDSNKWSVIYGQGKFKDHTVAVEDYRYASYGLLYMKEKEGRNYANKWGWYAGFAYSTFGFDDAPRLGGPSKETVFSLRAGIHGTKTLDADNTLRWKNRLELGYNFHDAKRTIELDKRYVNKGRYDSYQAKFTTRLEKTVHRTLSSKIDLYAGLNLEYGAIQKFKERGDGLHLSVRGKEYLSVQPEIGISAYKRKYLGKKVSVKLEADLAYSHELGSFYGGNRARVHKGDRGYYDLIRPEKEKGAVTGRVGLTIEKANKAGVTFEVEARKPMNKKDMDVRFGVRFKYVFGD
jgi:hypothetical protein